MKRLLISIAAAFLTLVVLRSIWLQPSFVAVGIFGLCILAIFVGLATWAIRAIASSATPTMYCQNCGSSCTPTKRVKGSFAIELILWICFLVPGLIYSIWRLTTKEKICPACGALNMIPVDSPKALAALAK